ncbi:MAG: hypothetical protein ABI317_00130 [Gaiellales bacterium]
MAIICALAVGVVPAASGATGDLAVTVARLKVPTKIVRGEQTSFVVRYVVRGPADKRASATVTLTLKGSANRYQFVSRPATVRPAIWSWSVTDSLPKTLSTGKYSVIARVTLKRSGKLVGHTSATVKATIS